MRSVVLLVVVSVVQYAYVCVCIHDNSSASSNACCYINLPPLQ